MAETLRMAVLRLSDVLERENQALAVMDIRRATALLPEKSAALAAFADLTPDPTLTREARYLDELARGNRRLLDRAIFVQNRVIGIVVRAAISAAPRPSYGAKGQIACAAGPMAVSTRA